MRLQSIISHHYIDIDSEIVYDICLDDLPELKATIQKIEIVLTKVRT
jgi:uncharacterized protein with HEPN domain